MIPIGQAMGGMQMRAFPAGSQCSGCGYFYTHLPEVQENLRERAESGKFTYEQWIDLVECRCKDINVQVQRASHFRLFDANLPHSDDPKTFASFTDKDGTTDASTAALAFSAFQGSKVLMLAGETGTGKSHLLEAIARVFLEKGATVRYEVSSRFLDQLRHTYSDNTQDLLDTMRWYQKMQLLVLDDLGLQKGSDWAIEKLTDLIDERLRLGKWMAIGTNLDHDEMAERVGHRLASRLFQRLGEVKIVALTAGDYRREG